ncbi:MAG: hypothetical protein CMJ25_06310 [Phycisphaerae bacterium]|nr:hypothetical protein [Phycisphaerae bacterium]|tara:strand:+ start:2749 stop:4809 length:2061 start_codon:yes stop_codon:yes gene_type:complete
MTITTTIIKNSYSGDNSQTVFPYTFKISADADIQVIIRSSLGTETVKSLSTDYTVSGAGDAGGGNVTMIVAPATGETLVIRRATVQTQTIDLVENDPFSAETVEGGFDKSVSLVQEIQEEADRAIKLSRTNTMASTEFTVDATTRAGKILGFDNAGELVVSQELGTFQGNWATATSYSARDIVKDTSNNNIYLCNTAHTSSGAQPISSNTDVAKWDLLVDAYSATQSATAAAASATAAATSETNAATSETNAATSATTATTQAGISTTQATASAASATAAQTAQAAAEAALDNFDDRFLGAKASDPTLDNDGDALTDGALYFNTTDDVMKVYDLGNTTWRQIQLTTSDQANVNTVAADLSGSNTIGTVATDIANVNTTATNIANINTTAGIDTEITNVSGISAAISAVNSNSSNINAVNANSTNINLVASNNTNVTNVGSNISSITTAANNLADINAFANIYLGPSATAPTQDPDGSALDVGDLYFDTASQTMKVYSSSGWTAAGSSVNGTASRYTYSISSSTTTVTGADDYGQTMAYDAGYIDVYLNGVKQVNSVDVTVTSGNSIVFASAIGTSGTDVVDVIAYGTFNLANFSINDATDVSTAGITDGQVLTWNASGSSFVAGNASSAEVYGFSVNSNGELIVTTTDGGNDNIDAATYASFDDVLFAASGFVFSIDNDGNLISTI